MNRRQFLKRAVVGTAAFSLAGCTANSAAKQLNKKPNVILIMTDDQGYGDVAAHGNKMIKTPNIDKLWTESLRLTNYHVDPTCAPTRSALMTGRYSSRTGVWHTIMGRSLLHEDEVTMADVFKGSGYKTGIFGKWHLGDNYPFRPQERGFDEVLVHGGGGVSQLPDYWGNDYFDDTYWHNGVTKKYKGYCTDVWFDGAMNFIESNKDKPFFCYLVTNAPHGPYLVSDEYADPYRSNPDVPNANFYGMITNIDDNIARIRKKLKDLHLADNTIFIFTTDNGTAAGIRGNKGFNDNMRGQKGSEYDGGHRVPCFIHWPNGNLNKGRDVKKLTCHVDMLPTLAGICGMKKPDVHLDGMDISPLLFHENINWKDRVMIVHSQRIEHPQKWRKCSVMTDRWRFVNGKELYDIIADPGQKNNVADKYPDVVTWLTDEYEKWWKSISARFDGYCEIVLGTKYENPSRLTSHDWHDGNPPWNQNQVRNAAKQNGFWAVRIAETGNYRIELRRWPREVNAGINEAVSNGKAINAVKARLKIADFDGTVDIEGTEKAAVFNCKLSKGSTRLQTWLYENDNSSRGAYFVYVERL